MKKEQGIVPFLTSAVLFLVGLVLIILCGFGVFQGNEKGDLPLITVTVSSVGSSLIATSIYVLITTLSKKDRLDEAQQSFSEETKKLQDYIYAVGSVINSNEVFRVVNSDINHAIDFGSIFKKSQSIDIACNTGGTIIENNKEALKIALKNGARIRILFNNENYEFFDPNNKQYEHLQNSLCPDKASRKHTGITIDTLKKIVRECRKSGILNGSINCFYSDGLITGQMVIIDDKLGYFTPYLPGQEIIDSFRVEFAESAEHHIEKLKKSFDTTWTSVLNKSEEEKQVNKILIN